jgi:gp16 family phage-associated protein
MPLKTLDQARAQFDQSGLSVFAWAAKRGYSHEILRGVLAGRLKGHRGQAHDVTSSSKRLIQGWPAHLVTRSLGESRQ